MNNRTVPEFFENLVQPPSNEGKTMRKYALILVTTVAIALSACAGSASEDADQSVSEPADADATTTETPAPETPDEPETTTTVEEEPSSPVTGCLDPMEVAEHFGYPTDMDVSSGVDEDGICSYVWLNGAFQSEVLYGVLTDPAVNEQAWNQTITAWNANSEPDQEQLDPSDNPTIAEYPADESATSVIAYALNGNSLCNVGHVLGNRAGWSSEELKEASSTFITRICGL